MLPVILTVLKTLGIALLVILALILFILLLVLLVPLRYRGTGAFHENKPSGEILVTWFGPLSAFTAGYKGSLYMKLRVLWIRLLGDKENTSGKDAEENKKEKKGKTGKKKKKEPAEGGKPGDEISDSPDGAEEKPPEEPKEEPKEEPEDGTAEKPEAGPVEKEPEKPEKKPLSDQISDAADALSDKLASLTDKADEKIPELEEKAEMVFSMLEDPANHKTALLLFKQLKKLLRHYIPRSLKGYLTLGLSDPYKMGQAMSAAAFFYPFYEKDFTFTPVFDEEIREGEFTFTGHVRLIHAAGAGIRILLDRNFRRLLKMILHRGG